MKYLYLTCTIVLIFYSCGTNQRLMELQNRGIASDYSEPHRPRIHFTPPAKWMNDPNGMVYHDGEYHLFYQHYPDSIVWGPMHWGHAVSEDLINWEHLPIALYPDERGMIFSGSAVIDENNSSRLGIANMPPMVAIFTYHDAEGEEAGRVDYQTQGIAYSLNDGRSWEKYQDNPVLENPGIKDFRDPKVMWYDEGKKWVMSLAVKDKISFYSSRNLKDWEHDSDFGENLGAQGGVWECPDLFPLQVEGSDEVKWVLLVSINPGGPNNGSATQYFIGDYDGHTFTPDEDWPLTEEGVWIDYGRDNYAGVTWNKGPHNDSRKIFMGWMSNWDYANVVPTESWRSAMTLPRSLSLENTDKGLRLVSTPVRELERLYLNTKTLTSQPLTDSLSINEAFTTQAIVFDLSLDLEGAHDNSDFHLELSNNLEQKVLVGYDSQRQQYYIDRSNAGNHEFSADFGGIQWGPRMVSDSNFSLRFIVDVASVELFADGGKTSMTSIFFPDEHFSNIKFFSTNGDLRINGGQLSELKAMWQ